MLSSVTEPTREEMIEKQSKLATIKDPLGSIGTSMSGSGRQ